jgi:hypothetical protein
VPAQGAQTTIQNLLARGNAIVVVVYGEPSAHGIKAAGVFILREPWDATGAPFRADIVGRSKRGGVVHHGAAAQTLAR